MHEFIRNKLTYNKECLSALRIRVKNANVRKRERSGVLA